MTIKLELTEKQVSQILYALHSSARDFAAYDMEKCNEYGQLEGQIEEIRHFQFIERLENFTEPMRKKIKEADKQ